MDLHGELERLVTLLEDEKSLLGKTLADAAFTEALEQVTQQKHALLEQIASYDATALQQHEELLKRIRELGEINMQIAQSNMLFIEELFSSIFKDSTSQYDENGAVSSKKEGLINKKI